MVERDRRRGPGDPVAGPYITLALFGAAMFEMFQWRQHAVSVSVSSTSWWHSAGSHPDGKLSLNIRRLNDPRHADALDTARSARDEAEATTAAGR